MISPMECPKNPRLRTSIKADGSVFLPEKSGWFHDDVTMSPGDTIVVPVEIDRLNNMTFWTSVSQIIYQMALGAAAISTF